MILGEKKIIILEKYEVCSFETGNEMVGMTRFNKFGLDPLPLVLYIFTRNVKSNFITFLFYLTTHHVNKIMLITTSMINHSIIFHSHPHFFNIIHFQNRLLILNILLVILYFILSKKRKK